MHVVGMICSGMQDSILSVISESPKRKHSHQTPQDEILPTDLKQMRGFADYAILSVASSPGDIVFGTLRYVNRVLSTIMLKLVHIVVQKLT